MISIAGNFKKAIFVVISIMLPFNLISQNIGSFTDSRDGEIYTSVQIGNLIWMAENMRLNLPGSYVNPDQPDKKYGRFYNWNQAQQVCPEGWQLPTDADWRNLERILGMSLNDLDKKFYRGEGIGTKLKSNEGWSSGECNNNSGFNALAAGYYAAYDKSYRELGQSAVFWSSSGINQNLKTYRYLVADSTTVYSYYSNKSYAYSCRCVKKEMIENDSFFSDRRDGQVYKTLKVGSKLWMAENLRYYETAGTAIPKDSTGIYGMLYNWTSLMNLKKKFNNIEYALGEKHRGNCPYGWHVPTDEEWSQLLDDLKSDNLAMTSETGWDDDLNGNNSSGFNAYPAGDFSILDGFYQFGKGAYFWTATQNSAKESTYFSISNVFGLGAGYNTDRKSRRLSCRCVKD